MSTYYGWKIKRHKVASTGQKMFFASRWHNAKQRKVLHVAHTTTRCFTRRNALLAHILDMEHKGADQ